MLSEFTITKEIDLFSSCLFLLYLLISGNYLANTFSCATQKYLNNRFTKQIIVFFSLFFFVKLTSPIKQDRDPLYDLIFTIPIYILFFISTKCSALYLSVFIIILFIIYYIYLHKNYHYKNFIDVEKKKNRKEFAVFFKNKNMDQKLEKYLRLEKIQIILATIGIISLITGFYTYFLRQHSEHNLEWSWKKFLLGIEKCENIGY